MDVDAGRMHQHAVGGRREGTNRKEALPARWNIA
jgi:hypothetical protein